MGTTNDVDLVIVGAGAAGLGAAHRAQDLGLSFRCLEAMDRIGGRAYTNYQHSARPGTGAATGSLGRSMSSPGWLTPMDQVRRTASAQRGVLTCALALALGEQSDLERTVYDEMRGAIAAALVMPVGMFPRRRSWTCPTDWIRALRTGLAGEWGVDIAEVSTATMLPIAIPTRLAGVRWLRDLAARLGIRVEFEHAGDRDQVGRCRSGCRNPVRIDHGGSGCHND